MRSCLLFALLLAACSKGPEADLATIGEARSLGAEWALVNEQAAKGQVTATYVRSMRKQVREQLQTAFDALTNPDSRYGRQIHALLAEPDNVPPEELRFHAAQLKSVEDSLEST